MKKIKSIAIAATMMVAGTTISFSQTKEHEHGSPHGGIVQTAGDYHIEMVNVKDKVTIYLLDAKEKTMSNKGITGSVILQFADKTSATVTLTQSGDDGFSVSNDKASAFTSCVVTFKVNGKAATAKFKRETTTSAVYQCPMKCEGEKTYSKPGKCPKCGMALAEVKAKKEEKKEEHKHDEGGHHH